MHRLPQTTAPRKQVSLPAPDPIPLGQRRYRVPSSTNPCVCYVVDLDAGTCGCPHFIHRQTPCKHLRAARKADDAACESVDASGSKTPHAPSQTQERGYFDERGEYVGPLAEAFDRPMRATRGGHR